MNNWNSEQYLKFEKERTQPSVDLAARIDINAPKRIIDIGCGPGNSTAVLRRKFPYAEILGIDYSQNMLERAVHDYPDISFRMTDISEDSWNIDGKYDIAFSNACIQWVPDHCRLLSKIMYILNDGGKMAVQIPMNYNEPIHRIIEEISGSEKWCEKFPNPRIFYTLTIEEYYDILTEISSDFEIWVTTYCHRMKSHHDIIEWYRSTGLKPYLEVLNDSEKDEFLADIFKEVQKQYISQKNGEVIFRFPRMFFTATK